MNAPIHIIVFGRSPISGRAKTRLIPALGPRGAADLCSLLLEHALATALAAGPDRVTLWLDAGPVTDETGELAARFQSGIALQVPGDLGTRMHDALCRTLESGDLPLLMGSDVPSLTPAALQQAAVLLRGGRDAVVAPAEDGGYGLIGVARPLPVLFEDMPWSTDAVLKETRRRCVRDGIGLAELEWIWDVDEPADLGRLADIPELAGWRQRIRVDAAV
ncbi:MAG: TIGR04282 family arsenosugar biosynthesis glycosyltransferase [Gammaproteobacteria bacterium]|nr:TIGR04282 family arsenosugar biosynthesis glycosyltransferase [Gammaproteobacteria bacterium]